MNEEEKIIEPLNKKSLVTGIILIVFGIIFLVYSILSIVFYNKKNSSYIEIEAVVKEYKEDINGLKAIVVEYEVDEEKYQLVSNSYSVRVQEIGDKVLIKYNKDNPIEAIWANDYYGNVFLIVIGVIGVGLGIFMVIKYIKKKKTEKIEDNVEKK